MSGTLKHLQKLQSLLSQKLTHLNMDGWKTIVSGYIWLQLLGLGPYPPITRWRTVDGPPQRWGLTGDGWSVLGVGTTKIGRFFFSLAICLFQISMTFDGLNYMATTYVVFFLGWVEIETHNWGAIHHELSELNPIFSKIASQFVQICPDR